MPGPYSFRTRRVTLPPGGSRRHDEDEWRGALIVVEAGELELRCRAGGSRVFGTGSVLWFTGLDLASVRNPGRVDTVFRALTRHRTG